MVSVVMGGWWEVWGSDVSAEWRVWCRKVSRPDFSSSELQGDTGLGLTQVTVEAPRLPHTVNSHTRKARGEKLYHLPFTAAQSSQHSLYF